MTGQVSLYTYDKSPSFAAKSDALLQISKNKFIWILGHNPTILKNIFFLKGIL